MADRLRSEHAWFRADDEFQDNRTLYSEVPCTLMDRDEQPCLEEFIWVYSRFR